MKEFFCSNKPPGSYELTAAESIIPIIIALSLVIILILTKKIIIGNASLDRGIRHIMGTLQLVLFVSDYLINWIFNGIKVYYLPFHLCSISSILCGILAFSMKRNIFNFVLFSGVLGGSGALLLPNLPYSSFYYKYYQFMGNHILIVMIPLYFLIIHHYMPSLKSVFGVYISMQMLIVVSGIFNYYYNTNYMFIQFGEKASAGTELLPTFGLPYGYLVNMEILGTMLFLLWYIMVLLIYKKSVSAT